MAPGRLGHLELDAGFEVRVVVDELAADAGGAGYAGDAHVGSALEGGIGGGEDEGGSVLAVGPAGVTHGLASVRLHWRPGPRGEGRGTTSGAACRSCPGTGRGSGGRAGAGR